jgi:hypothetical protein
MDYFFEWKPMIEEKKVKFTCTKLKGHGMIWLDHVHKYRERKRKRKNRTWSKMEKNCEKIVFLWTMPNPFFVDSELEEKLVHNRGTHKRVLSVVHSCGSLGN